MSRTATLLGTLAIALAAMLPALPAHAQRVFVSGRGSDSNPCTFALPCRTFQQAFNTAPADGEIDVLDPAGYGPLTIGHGISIQGHGFAAIIQTSGSDNAVTINTAIGNDVSLNGLLIDGAGSGQSGIQVNSVGALQILNCVIRHFTNAGINFTPTDGPSSLLVSDTVASDNAGVVAEGAGIHINPVNTAGANATLDRITANNNQYGVAVTLNASVMIANSVISNNSKSGLSADIGSTAWLGTSAISNNGIGVWLTGGTVNSYGNNQINGNTTDVSGSLTRVLTQ